MDYVRDPYNIACRPFKDDATEIQMRWRPASPGADTFSAPHKFTSLFQGYFNWVDGEHVGEVFEPSSYHGGLRAVNRWFNNLPALGYDVGLVPCEPLEDFATGETFDPDRPAATYNQDGFPLCCLNRWVPKFGVEWGMRATHLLTLGPDPGPDCESAEPADTMTLYTATVQDGIDQWWRFNVTTGLNMCFNNVSYATNPATMVFGIYRWDGTPSCPGALVLAENAAARPAATVFGSAMNPIAFVRVINASGGPVTYTFSLSSGACPGP